MVSAQDVLAFWLDEVGPSGWYKADDAVDQAIRDRFMSTWERAADGGLGLWLTCPSECLAYVIVTDQFSRNMFRGEATAFSTDHLARAAAKRAIDRDWDLKIDEPARALFYMPLIHAENLADQDRGVRCIHTRMPARGRDFLNDARVHREIIRRFGRFPYRNDALGRETTAPERQFFDQGGYGAIMQELKSSAA